MQSQYRFPDEFVKCQSHFRTVINTTDSSHCLISECVAEVDIGKVGLRELLLEIFSPVPSSPVCHKDVDR